MNTPKSGQAVAIALFVMIIAIFLFWAIPSVALWALNNVIVAYGGVRIALTLKTWFSMLLLIAIFAGSGNCNSK